MMGAQSMHHIQAMQRWPRATRWLPLARARINGESIRMPTPTRRPLLTLLVAAGLALATVTLPSAAARACSCAVSDVPSAREQATHVFEGVVTRGLPAEGDTPERVEFRVERVWKGAVSQTFAVAASLGMSMCPPYFEVGQRYVIYTSGPADAPRVERCARYAGSHSLATERAALGRPTQRFRARP
jgi:hypothetical protein